jgi:PEP-CTERM/exosortase A-associated glycosyltransferase
MTLKILHVLDHSIPLHSGYTFRTLSILREQRKLGWETLHLTSTKHFAAKDDEESVDGWHFFRTRSTPTLSRRLPVLNQAMVVNDTARRLDEVVRKVQPNLIHAHSPALNGLAAIRVARKHRLPVVYELRACWEDAAVDHGTTTEGSLRYRVSRGLESWVLRRADAVTTICEGLRQDICARGIPEERVTVIPNAVDPQQFPLIATADRELRAKYGLQNAFVLGFLGSFYGYEGLDVLIEALPGILEFEPNAKVLLVGGGREEPRLTERVAQLGLQDRVLLVGRVPHNDVARYYSLVDLLVYPRKSMRLTETVTPLKPLEAMAQGRLLIASAVGGHRELIRDGETGFLFEPDSPAALTQAVQRALQARVHWPKILQAGRHFVETERCWQTSVARYPAVYERAQRHVGGM